MDESMIFRSRDELEAIGRAGALAVDRGSYYLCRVLGSYWVAISKDDGGLRPHITDGFWEPWIMYWVSTHVPPACRCADLGANVGFYTFQLALNGCTVDAFEPNPVVFDNLSLAFQENPHLQPNIRLWQLAVSREAKPVDFRVPRGHPMNGGIAQLMHEPPGDYDAYAVNSSDRLGQEHYDFIKIDIEGGERDVFELLNPQLHPLVLMEFRWDRYQDPENFAAGIFAKYRHVAEVNFDGGEATLGHPDQLAERKNEDWMLVLT
jgi:FkbM family methyltransferase